MVARNITGPDYYLSGSDRDYFQDYNGEHCVILDEFRPDKITYSDLLKMLDNNRFDVSAPARYHDKKILADLIVITSPSQQDIIKMLRTFDLQLMDLINLIED